MKNEYTIIPTPLPSKILFPFPSNHQNKSVHLVEKALKPTIIPDHSPLYIHYLPIPNPSLILPLNPFSPPLPLPLVPSHPPSPISHPPKPRLPFIPSPDPSLVELNIDGTAIGQLKRSLAFIIHPGVMSTMSRVVVASSDKAGLGGWHAAR